MGLVHMFKPLENELTLSNPGPRAHCDSCYFLLLVLTQRSGTRVGEDILADDNEARVLVLNATTLEPGHEAKKTKHLTPDVLPSLMGKVLELESCHWLKMV